MWKGFEMEFVYNNYSDLLPDVLRKVLTEGETHHSRAGETKELREVLLTLKNNRRRISLVANRLNNPLATIVETMWMLAGSNNASWLSQFLPRALDFSDDNLTWKNGYGPRLRNWREKDQIVEAMSELKANPNSRRCVINIYDASTCLNVDTKDVSCNIVLNFYVRDDKLNLVVMSRSMDILWGSMVNFYSWSILQEFMANWLEIEVGKYSHLVTSLHLYDSHYKRAKVIVETNDTGIYDQINLPIIKAGGSLSDFLGFTRDFKSYIDTSKAGLKRLSSFFTIGSKINNIFDLCRVCVYLQKTLSTLEGQLKREDPVQMNECLQNIKTSVNSIPSSYSRISILNYLLKKVKNLQRSDFDLSSEELKLLNYLKVGKDTK